MTPLDRRLKIIDLISQYTQASVEYLSKQCDASSETIRRDLSILSDEGKVQRIHGGAKLPVLNLEAPFSNRLQEFTKEKEALSRKASALVTAGDSLFIDTGSTTICFAKAIAHIPQLTVITNSFDVAKMIQSGSGKSKVILLGGEFNAHNNQTIGSMVIAQIKTFHANFAFITVGGVDKHYGITDFDFDEAQIAKAMLGQSSSKIILADNTKINRLTTYKVCEIEDVSLLFCDEEVDINIAQHIHHVEKVSS